MNLSITLGALGFGNMGAAIVRGALEKGALVPGHVVVFDVAAPCLAEARTLGVRVADSPEALARECDTILIAVKPQQFDEAIAPMRACLRPGARLISIMAGISMAYLARAAGDGCKIVRVMPNLPAQAGAGAAALAFSAACDATDRAIALRLFEAVGCAESVPESAMDTITALSGSGPAYCFLLAECMAKAAVQQGLPADQAQRLAAQTLLGAGVLLDRSGEAAATLRERVTSKGGTTAAALQVFAERDFAGAVQAAMDAAARRSKELGK